MNYRHAYHVGNHADVLKHATLLFCLEALLRKPSAYSVLETHAGRGLYDLSSAESARSPEWRDGIAKLWGLPDPPPLIRRLLDAVRSFNPDGALAHYPGSPGLTARALRDDDELVACELHPEEFAALRRSLPRAANIHLHRRDGWEALKALVPPKRNRGLVLIDPPYEADDELTFAVRALSAALLRFAHGSYVWWRPLKSESALDIVDAELLSTGVRSWLRADLWIDTPKPAGKLVGSSLFVINPPFGLDAELRNASPILAAAMSIGAHGWRVTSS